MNGRVHVTSNAIVSADVADGGTIDAGAYATTGGIELAITQARISTLSGPDEYRQPLTLFLSIKRADMERLLFELAAKLGLPAFNEREWRAIRGSVDRDLIAGASGATGIERDALVAVSNAIAEAYKP